MHSLGPSLTCSTRPVLELVEKRIVMSSFERLKSMISVMLNAFCKYDNEFAFEPVSTHAEIGKSLT